MAKLKVFRTPIGFYDAYVAAPSRKAALAAWGADADLFARGVAEQVTDAGLLAEPLRRPGEVIRLTRGEASDHFKEIAKTDKLRAPRPEVPDRKAERPVENEAAPSRPKAKPKPMPSRAGIEKAEQAIAKEEASFAGALKAFEARAEALREEQSEARRAHDRKTAKLKDALEKSRETYRRKLENWAGE